MLSFTAEILKFGQKGDKTGWSYIEIPASLAARIKPQNRRGFRVRGSMDKVAFDGLSLIPAGEGDFILPVNGSLRRQLGKQEGDIVQLSLEEDTDFKIELPDDLETCLLEQEEWYQRFMALTKSHRHYFINHINGAKTIETRSKRIAQTVEAMDLGLDFGAMIRKSRKH